MFVAVSLFHSYSNSDSSMGSDSSGSYYPSVARAFGVSMTLVSVPNLT